MKNRLAMKLLGGTAWGWCLAVATIVIASVARAQAPEPAIPAQLSLDEAEQIFLNQGLDLLVAQYGFQGAQGDVTAAGAHPNPGIDLAPLFSPAISHDVFYSIGNQSPTPLWGFSLGLTDNAAIEDQLSGKRSLRIEQASKLLAAARFNVQDIRRMELSQLRQAYVAAVMAGRNLAAAQESFTTYDKQANLNQIRYKTGSIGGLDLSRAVQARLEALQAQDQAQSGLKQAMASLMFLLGVRQGAPQVALTTGIAFAPLAKLQAATVESLDALALQQRPDLQVALSNLSAAEVALRQAKKARLPDISLSAGYSEQCSSTSCSSEPAVTVGLQGNLPVLYQQQGEIQRAQSNYQQAQVEVDKIRAQVLMDVTQALAAYTAATSQVQRMEGQLLKQAKLSRDLAQLMYQKGAASFVDFLDAQRSYVSSELEYNQDLANYWAAVYQLEQATGTRLR